MKETVTEYRFIKAFEDYHRSGNFSENGLKALFDYLDEFEGNDEIELDVIAFCCEFSEYESLKEFQDDHDDKYETIEQIEEITTVIEVDGGGLIVRDF